MRFLNFFLLFSLIYSCQEMQEAVNYRYPANSEDRPMVWKGGLHAFPLELEISANFNTHQFDAINKAAVSWASSVDYAVPDFFTFSPNRPDADYSNFESYRNGKMGVYLLSEWPSNRAGTLALAQLSGEIKEAGNISEYLEIQHADILVNNRYFEGLSTYDMETVVLHEMGHVLGLIHDNSHPDYTVMFPTISSSDRKTEPLYRDVNHLKQKYNIGMITPMQARQAEQMKRNENIAGEPFTLILELRADGKCAHFLNGELIHEH